MTDDVKDFVTICERCQRTNDKFTKPESVLQYLLSQKSGSMQVNFHNSYTHLICDIHN